MTNAVYSRYWIILKLHACLAQSQGDTYIYCLHSLAIWFSLFLCAKIFCFPPLSFTCLVLVKMQGLCLPSAPSILLCLTLSAFWPYVFSCIFPACLCSSRNTPSALKVAVFIRFHWGIQTFLTVKYSVIAGSSNLDEHDKWQQVGFIKVNGLMIYKWRYIRVKIIALIVPLNNVNFEYTVLECPGEVSLLLY